MSRKIEAAPLPPLNMPAANAEGFMPPVRSIPPAAAPVIAVPPAPSPYERSRTVERMELESPVPAAPSPFNPPAVLKAPQPRAEAPRTAPAVVVKPQPLSPLEGGAPVVVESDEALEGVDLPAENVSRAIKTDKEVVTDVALPVRKPGNLPAAPAAPETVMAKTPAAAPVTMLETPPEPPVMPAGIRSADSVIEDLYTLPPIEGGEELAALPLMENEQAPPAARAAVETNAAPAVGLLIFDGTTATLDEAMRDTLGDVVKRMKKEDGKRLLIRAYAAGGDGSKASARNISLARALAVRSHLMDQGLATKSIDVRAMGRDTSVSPLDRVDLVLSE